MKLMIPYDAMESMRVTGQLMGAAARALGAYPAFALMPGPGLSTLTAWGEVAERSFARMVVKPDWNIDSVVGVDGRDHVVTWTPELRTPFGDLLRFDVAGREAAPRRILLVAPMSGHYATLLRSTVKSLLPDADVWITDWNNARDIPVSAGKFDVEDYTLLLRDFIRHLGPDLHVIAVCQPVPLSLAATALIAAESPEDQPATLTLIGGPVDPDAAPTEVTDFGARITMGQLEETMIQRVGFKHRGAGRLVYPGLLQLSSFMAMNADRHGQAFFDQIMRAAKGETSDHDKHNRFYDEYLAVMDMTAEFYLSTVERVFKARELARNAFTVEGTLADLTRIDRTAVMVVEGEEDDISAPGQCLAALDLLTGLPDHMKAAHLQPRAGHYGIFAGRAWRDDIRPFVLDFIDRSAQLDPAKRRARGGRAATVAGTATGAAVAKPVGGPTPV